MKPKKAAAILGLLVLLAAACAAGAAREEPSTAFPPPGETGERWVVTDVVYEMEGERVRAVTLRMERVNVRHAAAGGAQALALRR